MAQNLILDADGDTSITADTDDQIDIKIANAQTIVKLATSSGDTVYTANRQMQKI